VGVPGWLAQNYSELSDEGLLEKVWTAGDGYAAWMLQERQHRQRTYRRRKLLARINRFFYWRNRGIVQTHLPW